MKSQSFSVDSVFQRKTICHHPRLLKGVHFLVGGFFRLWGWHFEPAPATGSKYVLVVAPHTSNWDFFLLVAVGAALGRQVRFMGKHSIFVGPFNRLLRWLGGIPVERSSRHNFVEQMVAQFDAADDMVLIIAPEGTRGYVPEWKGGFYHIACGAGVPVVAVGLDYRQRRVRFVGEFQPCGDFSADMDLIAEAYRDVSGRFPQQDAFRDRRAGKPQ